MGEKKNHQNQNFPWNFLSNLCLFSVGKSLGHPLPAPPPGGLSFFVPFCQLAWRGKLHFSDGHKTQTKMTLKYTKRLSKWPIYSSTISWFSKFFFLWSNVHVWPKNHLFKVTSTSTKWGENIKWNARGIIKINQQVNNSFTEMSPSLHGRTSFTWRQQNLN